MMSVNRTESAKHRTGTSISYRLLSLRRHEKTKERIVRQFKVEFAYSLITHGTLSEDPSEIGSTWTREALVVNE